MMDSNHTDFNNTDITTNITTNITMNHHPGSTFAENNSNLPFHGLNISDYDFFDYGTTSYLGEIKHVPLWEIIVKIAFYAIIIFVAVSGNLLIIIVVARNKRMRTTTNFYIVNLAVSDLLVTVFCTWVKLVDNLTEGWVLGAFFCKMNSFAQVVSLVASIFSLILIACDRFFGIVFAMKAHIIERKASHSIVLIWIASLGVAVPLLFVRQLFSITWLDHEEIWCDDAWPMVKHVDEGTGYIVHSFPGRQAYYAFLSIVLYFLPMIVMTCMYIVIILTVWFARAPGETITGQEVKVQRRVKRKVVKMLVLILATFGICWLPLQICILYTEFRPNKHEMLSEGFWTLEFISYTLAFSNSAFNPIIYAGFNENFRKGFRGLFNCYEKKKYTAISRVDSMYNSSTTMSKV